MPCCRWAVTAREKTRQAHAELNSWHSNILSFLQLLPQ